MVQKQFIKVSTDKLIPYENNPRINDPAVADVVESIKQCENLDPIEVDEDFVILSGHTRLLAMQQLGITETEVVQYNGLTDEQKRKYRILANKTNELAEWDFDRLEEEIADLDFSNFSFGDELSEGGADSTELSEDTGQKGSLAERYLVPPFSVLYANKHKWLERKRLWISFGIRSEVGRGGNLTYNSTADPEANFANRWGANSVKQTKTADMALSNNTIARYRQMQKQQAYRDGLLKHREKW